MGNARGAMDLFDEAERLDPENADILFNRARLWSMLGRPQQALADLNRASAVSPSADVHEQRGILLVQVGDRDGGRAAFEAAIALDNGSSLAWANLGGLALDDTEFDQAIRCYDRAINIEPTLAVAYVNRARALHGLGRTTQAKRDLEIAEQLMQSGADSTNRSST